MPDDNEVAPREFWDDQKITHVKIPIDTLRKALGIEHRVMDIEIDPYVKYVSITLDTVHFEQ
jgi:hypothetical protein